MAASEKIWDKVLYLGAATLALAIMGVLLIFFLIPFLLVILALVAVGIAISWLSPRRRWPTSSDQETSGPVAAELPPAVQVIELPPYAEPGPSLAVPPLGEALVAGWPMADADPQRSRRSQSRGARHGRVVWKWTPEGKDPYLNAPLVAADHSAIVINWHNRDRAALSVLSPEGALLRELPVAGICLGEEGTLFGVSGGLLTAMSLEGRVHWEKKLPGSPTNMYRTPAGELLVSTREAGFARYTSSGGEQGLCYPELQAWLGGLGIAQLRLTFDRSGNLYAAWADSWRGDPDDLSEQFRTIACFDAQGRKAWERNLTASDATDPPEFTTQHIWGLEDSAVFLGDSRIQATSPQGKVLWEMTRAKDFERIVAVNELDLTLLWDRRLRGGPLAAALSNGHWEYLRSAALDGEGNLYFCRPHALVSLDAGLRLRWVGSLPEEYLYDVAIGPRETVLVRSYGTLYAVE